MLEVSAAGYYQWLDRGDRSIPSWGPAATAAFSRHALRTTVADPAAVVAENLLLGQPAPTAPNQV